MMMSAKEIEDSIKSNGQEPSDIFERMYYYPLRCLAVGYKRKLITKEELLVQQKELKRLYEQLLMWDNIVKQHQKINIALSQVQLCDCDKCREIERIMRGKGE